MNLCKTELHMHTMEVSPCGRLFARAGVRLCHKLGYQAVVITDHFTTRFFEPLSKLPWRTQVDFYLSGYRKALKEGQKLGVQVLLGMEYCIPGTHDDILIYGFDPDFLYQNESLYRLNAQELAAKAKEHNLLLIQAHPFRKKISRVYNEMVEGLEVYNGNARHNSQNEKARTYANSHQWIAISGSDMHRREDAGTGGVLLPKVPKDERELITLLRTIKNPERIEIQGIHKPTFADKINRWLKSRPK